MAVRPIIDDDNLGEEDADSDDLEMKLEWNIGGGGGKELSLIAFETCHVYHYSSWTFFSLREARCCSFDMNWCWIVE